MPDDVSIDQFHAVPALKGLTAAELDEVDNITYSVALKAGQTLFNEGDDGDGLYLIVSGGIEVTKQIDQDARWQIARLEPGACFGEMALLGNQQRAATCTALTPTLLLKVPLKDFNQMLKASNVAALKVTANLARILCGRLNKLLVDQARLLKAQRALSTDTQKKLLTVYQRGEGFV
jgi:CRP-like cAMP-binding protein